MRETRGGGREGGLPHPKPVRQIELSTEHRRLRLLLTALFLVVGVVSLAYGVTNLSAKDPGWCEVRAVSSGPNCGGDFVFLYRLGEGGVSATAEYKALASLYSDAAEYAFRMFTNDVAYENTHNIHYISRHPNEVMEVDDCLYRAFSLIRASGDRSLYLGPVYAQYNGLFHCAEEAQAAEYDPRRNPAIADYYAAIAGFAGNDRMIDIELLGENRICLRVAGEYLDFAAENEIESFLDFYWMKNAFIADYLAETMLAAGYRNGCISSVDGFTRNLDPGGETYACTFYGRKGPDAYPAVTVEYSGPSGMVYLRDYAVNGAQTQFFYTYSDGEIRTPYLDVRDGFCRSSVSDLLCYGREYGCAEILLRMIPVYIADTLRRDRLDALAGEGIFSIYSEDGEIFHNGEGLRLVPLRSG